MHWIIYALLACFIFAIVNILDDIIVDKKFRDYRLTTIVIGFIAFIIGIII